MRAEDLLADYSKVAYQSDPPLWTSAVAVSKKAVLEVGGFPIGITAGEDLLLWAKLAARFSIAYIRTPLACFWAPVQMTDRPPRYPLVPDREAEGLRELLATSPPRQVEGLQEYLGLWHRMRGVIFLKLNRGTEARSEFRLALRHSACSARIMLLWGLSLLPDPLPARSQTSLAILIDHFRLLTIRIT